MFSTILIANRGEIACRIISTARAMGIETVAVYSDADAHALHVEMADEAVHIGPAPAAESYLRAERIIEAALETGAGAIHPGYGFLSENPDFVTAIEAAGLTFIGPSAAAIARMGLKDAAKTLMQEAGVPVVPGYHGDNQDTEFLATEAEKTGYPVLIKPRAGGGGIGIRKVDRGEDFAAALESAQREAQASFGDPHVLIEKYIGAPRHIEVQIFGDIHGNFIHLFERDCSLQRRYQKVIEEAPAPGMSDEMRAAMTDAALKAAKAIGYTGAGTVEFIVDGSGPLRPDGFWFMEMNTRLQVEHPVTEAITGHDLVEWQIRVAAGEPLPESQADQRIDGHAIEARLYAEDAANGFLPVTGRLHHLAFGDARIDTGFGQGGVISPHYDPMIAKIICHGATRAEALARLRRALGRTHVAGTITNIGFLSALCAHEGFAAGDADTGLIERDLKLLTATGNIPELAIAFAAIVALDLDLNAPFAGWRHWGEASHQVILAHGEVPFTRRLVLHGRQSVSLQGGASDVKLDDVQRDGARFRATVAGLKITADVVDYPASGGTRCVSVLLEGETWLLSVPDPLAGRDTGTSHENTITAPMTGVVCVMQAQAGASVKAGDGLIVIEAMKMQHSLTAPRDCTIAEVLCAEGDWVESGAVLLRLEEDQAEKGG